MPEQIKNGYCQCGCGHKTNVAKITDKSKGWIKGHPLRFLKGHNLKQIAKDNSLKAIGNKGLSSHGYVRVLTKTGRQYEHILIAEEKLGRSLKYFGPGNPDNEVVHHIDGDKTNNKKENLMIMTHSEHVAWHDTHFPKRRKSWHNL